MAQGKVTSSSSTYSTYTANLAVDGNTDPNFGIGSCFCTAGEATPWWKVELGGIYKINAVTLTNRVAAGKYANITIILLGNLESVFLSPTQPQVHIIYQ